MNRTVKFLLGNIVSLLILTTSTGQVLAQDTAINDEIQALKKTATALGRQPKKPAKNTG